MSRDLNRNLIVNALWSIGGRVGYLIVGLTTNIILVRLLGPEEFGRVGIVMVFILIASVLVESGLSGALIRKDRVQDEDYSTVFIFNIIVSLLLMLLMVSTSELVANFYQDPILKSMLIVSSVILPITSLRVSQTVKLVKELRFKTKVICEFLAILVASIVSILLAINQVGVWALVFLQLSSSAVLTVLLWIVVGPLKSYKFNLRSFQEFYKFGVNTTLASLLNVIFDNIYPVIIGKYFSISQTGYFYQAKKLQEMPVTIIQSTISSVVYSVLSRLQYEPKNFNSLYGQVVKIFTVVVALLCLVIYFYSESIVVLLYGDEWATSGGYLKLLIIAGFFFMQEMFSRIIFKIYNRTGRILQLEILKKIIQAVTIAYGVWSMSIDNLIVGFVLISGFGFFISCYMASVIRSCFFWGELWGVFKIVFAAVLSVWLCEKIAAEIILVRGGEALLFPVLVFLYFVLLYVLGVSNIVKDSKFLFAIMRRARENID